MKRIFDWLVRFWWLFPLVGTACSCLLFPILDSCVKGARVPLVGLIGVALLCICVQLIVFVAALFRHKWWVAVGTFLTGVVSLVAFIAFPLLIVCMTLQSAPDDFGGKHPNPEGLEYSFPLGYIIDETGERMDAPFSLKECHAEEPTIDSLDSQSWLQIWNGFQGGIYEYDLYYPSLPDGEIYLRCFEVTENMELSASRIRESSKVQVKGHTDFGKIADREEFTVYEGDWEDYYAVRVEVWHHNAITGKERRLLQKVYRMEGWMR